MEDKNIRALVDMSEIDEVIHNVERLNQLLEEANSLVNELASKKVTVMASIAKINS